MEMNFCRRCGQPLTNDRDHVYICKDGHVIFANASPASSVIFVNDKKEALLAVRGMEPGKGNFDIPGGFTDHMETAESACEREMLEELGLSPQNYDPPQYILTYVDQYDYKGETIPVLSLMYWARIKPDAVVKAADDVAEAIFMRYEDMDFDKFQFESAVTSLRRLRELDII